MLSNIHSFSGVDPTSGHGASLVSNQMAWAKPTTHLTDRSIVCAACVNTHAVPRLQDIVPATSLRAQNNSQLVNWLVAP